MFTLPDSHEIIALSLAEDLGVDTGAFSAHAVPDARLLARDVTSFSAVDIDRRFRGHVVAREDAIVAGLPVFATVFEALSRAAGLFDPIEVFPLVAEGARVTAGTGVLDI